MVAIYAKRPAGKALFVCPQGSHARDRRLKGPGSDGIGPALQRSLSPSGSTRGSRATGRTLALDPCVSEVCQDGCGTEAVGSPVIADREPAEAPSRVSKPT